MTDYGHSTLGKDKRYHTDLTVELEERGINALTNLDPKEYERKTKKKAEVVVAPSGLRMAHIYVLTERQRVFEALRDIESVEFIFFREGERIFVLYLFRMVWMYTISKNMNLGMNTQKLLKGLMRRFCNHS